MGQVVSSTCGEHSIMYKLLKSPSCTPEINTILHANYTQIKRKKEKKGRQKVSGATLTITGFA